MRTAPTSAVVIDMLTLMNVIVFVLSAFFIYILFMQTTVYDSNC